MSDVIELKKRYAPARISPDQAYEILLRDAMVAMSSFRETQLVSFLDQAKEATDALHQRAHQ